MKAPAEFPYQYKRYYQQEAFANHMKNCPYNDNNPNWDEIKNKAVYSIFIKRYIIRRDGSCIQEPSPYCL